MIYDSLSLLQCFQEYSTYELLYSITVVEAGTDLTYIAVIIAGVGITGTHYDYVHHPRHHLCDHVVIDCVITDSIFIFRFFVLHYWLRTILIIWTECCLQCCL